VELGILSESYESSGNSGVINKHDDDYGGMIYGAYQFNNGAWIIQSTIQWRSDNKILSE